MLTIKHHHHAARRGAARGFALLEALVSFLILSIGILGVVGLQATMAKASTASKSRADAAYLAHQVIGTAWADRANLAQYSNANCNGHAPCADWKAKVAAGLPSGNGSVTVNAGTGQFQVQVNWTAPNEPAHNYSTVTSITP
jgi:type IV pilus assembly protein PilV